jgi:hypothetical protein
MSTTALETNESKFTSLSPKATTWCRRIAEIAKKRIFRVKTLQDQANLVDPDNLQFVLLPKVFQRKRLSHNDGTSVVMLHPQFFDEKGNLRKKMPRELRTELKASIFKELALFVTQRPNADYYKIMVRCPWAGSRVDGAKGSETQASSVLSEKRERRLQNRRSVEEVPTGLHEDVKMWSLTEGKHVLVKGAEIFLANGKIKIARGTHNGKNLRTMLPGGKKLAEQLKLAV